MLVFEDPKFKGVGDTVKAGVSTDGTAILTLIPWFPPFEVTEIVPL
jgi:hypothetical protein